MHNYPLFFGGELIELHINISVRKQTSLRKCGGWFVVLPKYAFVNQNINYFACLMRKLLPTTDTLEAAMAAAAIIGESSPRAANGTAAML